MRKVDFIENADEIDITDEAIEKVYAELHASLYLIRLLRYNNPNFINNGTLYETVDFGRFKTTAKKLNIEFPEATEFSLCPVQFLGVSKNGECSILYCLPVSDIRLSKSRNCVKFSFAVIQVIPQAAVINKIRVIVP